MLDRQVVKEFLEGKLKGVEIPKDILVPKIMWGIAKNEETRK